jgi:hypothetical protein
MNQSEFNTELDAVIKRIIDVLERKRAEYSTASDRLIYFKTATSGLSLSTTPEVHAWELLVKHLICVRDIISDVDKGYEGWPKREYVDEKFGDAINYLILIEMLIKERIKEYEQIKG